MSKSMRDFYRGKSSPKLGYFCNFHRTVQRKQLPNGRKFAQSGHPASKTRSDSRRSKWTKKSVFHFFPKQILIYFSEKNEQQIEV
jgi:hypothetical protein